MNPNDCNKTIYIYIYIFHDHGQSSEYKSGLDLCRFPFFVLRHEVSLGYKTLDPVLRLVAWSLNVAFLNVLFYFSHIPCCIF